MFSIIVAISLNRVIGKDWKLPWHIPEDLKNFKHLTTNKKIVMWYNTYLSIWKPLPNRENIVLSYQAKNIPWCEVFGSIDQLLQKLDSNEEVMIIWWESIYKQFLEKDLIQKIYLSLIPKEVEGDTFFPFFEDKFKLDFEDPRWDYVFREYVRK